MDTRKRVEMEGRKVMKCKC